MFYSPSRCTSWLCAGFLILTAAWAIPAIAQDDEVIEEVIVRARHFSEAVTDVPATVSVLTAEQIQRAGIRRTADWIRLIPGISIVDAAEVADTQINIRGINSSRDAENSIAFIVDGILMSNTAAFNREYSNAQQIEVLKGPQGALYGRNASAGAIIVTTEQPREQFGADLRATVAEDSTYQAKAMITGPMGDSAAYLLSGDFRQSDGYYTNVFQSADIVDDFENFDIDGRLLFDLGENTSLDAKAHYGEVDAAAITFNAVFHLPAFASAFAPVLDPLFGAGFAAFFDEDSNDHNFIFQPNIDSQNDQEALELSLKLDHDADWGTVTAWTLYSDYQNAFSADGTSGAFGFFNLEPTCLQSSTDLTLAGITLPPPQILLPSDGSFGADPIFGPYTPTTCDGTQYQVRDQEDISFEIRFASHADREVRWLGGFYYLNIDREVGVNLGIDQGSGVTEALFVPQMGANPTEQLVHDQFDTDVYAFFGQVAADAGENVELSLALRYDKEERDVTNLVPPCPPACTQYVDFTLDGMFTGGAPLNPGLDPSINPSGMILPKSASFDKLQPKFSIRWDATDEWTLFGNYGVGFKSGGFNNQGSMATVDLFFNQPLGLDLVIHDQFDEETSDALEIGWKSVFNNGDVAFNGAFYRTTVSDMQFFEFLVGPFGLLRVVSNIDDVDIEGIELDLAWDAADWLDIQAGVNFIDSEIKANSSRPVTVGNKSPYTPDYNGNIAALVDFPFGNNLNFVGSLYWQIVGPTWFHTMQNNTRTTLFELGFPGLGTANYSKTQRDEYQTLDLRLGVESESWSATIFGTNITDEEYLEENITAPEFGGSFVHPGTLARWGVEFVYRL